MPRILILTKPKFFSLGPGIPKCSGDWWQGCERVYCHLTLYDCHVAKIDVGPLNLSMSNHIVNALSLLTIEERFCIIN